MIFKWWINIIFTDVRESLILDILASERKQSSGEIIRDGFYIQGKENTVILRDAHKLFR